VGKNAMLLNPKAGSLFFLGELYVDLPLPVDPPFPRDHCGSCTECDNCMVFCPDNAIHVSADGFGYDIDYDHCKGCGVCVQECPRGSMEMVPEAEIPPVGNL